VREILDAGLAATDHFVERLRYESVAEFRRRVPSIDSAGFFEKIEEVRGEVGGLGSHDEGLCPQIAA